MWEELRLPNSAPLPLKQNGTINVNQNMRLPNKVKANRETCKVWKMCMHHTRSILCWANEVGQHQKKSKYICIQKWNDKCISQQRIFRRLLQWWWTTYKMRHNKNQPARYSLVWPSHFFRYYFVVAEKQKNAVWTCEATCKGSHGGRLAHCVS